MSSEAEIPGTLRRILERLVPSERRADVLGDLEEAHRLRVARLGARAARRRLWREAAGIALWRVGARRRRRERTGAYDGIGPATRSESVASHPVGAARRGSRRAGPNAHAAGAATMARDLFQDVRFGLRSLRRRPGFALTAVAVLGLGIGGPVTVLTLVSRIFLERPPHVVEPHRLVRVWRSWAVGRSGGALMHPDYRHYREHVTALEELAAWGGETEASYTLDGARHDQLTALFVSDNYFDVLGAAPPRGRFFVPEENTEPGADPVAVVSDGFWRRVLAADPGSVGRTFAVNGIAFTVVGVAPPGFRGLSAFSRGPDVWMPLAMRGALTRSRDAAWWERLPNLRERWLQVVGRLAPGATFAAAEAELRAISSALTYPGRRDDEGILATREAIYSPSQATSLRTLSTMLLAAAGIVLAIAIANVAVLLLSRTATRVREIGIRTAVGAGRGRLFRQLLAESSVLAVAGGAVGVALAYAFSDAAATLLPFPFAVTFTPDVRVLTAAVAIVVGTAALAGLAPALRVAGTDVGAGLGAARGAPRRGRARDALVVTQIALSLILVTGAALFARSFWAARTQDLGFATKDRLVLQVDLRARGYTEDEGRAFIPRALERLRALPGVEGVATTRTIPFRGEWSTDLDPPPGALPNTEEGKLWVGLNVVSPGYFDVLEIPIGRGRPIGEEDGAGDAPAVVVNETLAGLLWPGEDPLGRTVRLLDDTDFTVVGVARDGLYYELGEEPTTQLWGGVAQVYEPVVHFVVHARGPAGALAGAAGDALREIDPALAIGWVTSLEAVFEDVTARYEVTAVLVGLFAALALALAAAGLYGVVSFLVARHTRDIGVRMALGADARRVGRQVLGEGLALAAAGVVPGAAGAWLLSRFAGSLLYGVEPADPWAVLTAAAVLASATLLAALGPARRAARVDPLEAIRTE